MRKKILTMTAIVSVLILGLNGCQTTTKNWGGNTTLELEPNEKLEEITWKDDSLWYLTRPMTEDDIAETHVFKQSSNWGVLEGTVTIVESKK